MTWPPTDPEGTYWRRALRVAVVLPAVLALALELLPRNSVVFAVFGVVAALSMADFGGPPLRRAGAYASLGVIGLANIVIGSLASHWVVAGVVAALVVGLTARLLAVFGGYWGTGSFAALLAFVLAVTNELPHGALWDRLGGWALGCAAATVAALLLWPRRRQREYRRLVARATDCAAARLRLHLPDPSDEQRDQADRTIEELDAARQWLLTTPYRPSGPAEGDRVLVDMTMLLERTAHAALRLDEADGPEPVDVDPLVRATAELLEGCSRRLGGDRRPLLDAARAVETARHDLDAQVEDWVRAGRPAASGASDAASAPRVLQRCFRALSCARLAEELAWCVEYTVGGEDDALATLIGRVPDPQQWSRTALRILRSHLTLRSAWLRQSLQTGVGLALAVGIAMATGIEHGFWVVLGTLSVLRTSARATTSTALHAVLGTALGFGAAAAAMALTHDSNTALWVLLPLVAFAAVYAAGVVDDIWGQAGFTLMVVMIFDLIAPGGWEIGLVRVQTVAIGAAVSVVVALLLWPRGAAQVVRGDVAEYFTAIGDQVAGVVDAVAGRPPTGGLAPLDRAASEDHQRAVQAYSEYLGESPVHLQRWGIWARLLFVPAYAAFAARHVERALLSRGTTMSPGVAGSLAAHGELLGARLSDVGARLAASTSAADGVVGPPADECAVAPPVSDSVLTADLERAKGSAELSRRAVTQVWVDCWLRDLDQVVDGVEAPLAQLHAPVRSEWWSWRPSRVEHVDVFDRTPDANRPAR